MAVELIIKMSGSVEVMIDYKSYNITEAQKLLPPALYDQILKFVVRNCVSNAINEPGLESLTSISE